MSSVHELMLTLYMLGPPLAGALLGASWAYNHAVRHQEGGRWLILAPMFAGMAGGSIGCFVALALIWIVHGDIFDLF